MFHTEKRKDLINKSQLVDWMAAFPNCSNFRFWCNKLIDCQNQWEQYQIKVHTMNAFHLPQSMYIQTADR